MASDDWWTGSPQAGLDRALSTGMLPPPGTLPQEMENAYRMAPAEHDPWSFDAPKGPTRGELVAGWQRQAQESAESDRQRREAAERSEMAGNLRRMASAGGPRKKKKGPTMQDAGDALAGAESRSSSIF